MNIKIIFIVTISLGVASARRRKIISQQIQKPNTLVIIQNTAIPEPTVKDSDMKCFRNKETHYREELINSPPALELPSGLGYFPSALPLVAKCFQPEFDPYDKGTDLPIAGSMTIAAPLCSDYEYLVKSIIL